MSTGTVGICNVGFCEGRKTRGAGERLPEQGQENTSHIQMPNVVAPIWESNPGQPNER